MRWQWPILLALLPAISSLAQEDARTRAAREELERQLEELTRAPPPRLELLFESPPGLGFELVEAQFTLDGVKLVAPAIAELKTPGAHPVFIAMVPPGRHQVVSQLVFVRSASGVFSYLEGFRWKLHARVGFETAPGTQVRVRVTVARNPDAKDERDELKLNHVLEGTVLLPEPTDAPAADAGPPADAGTRGPQARPEAAMLRVEVTARKKPVDATVRLFGEDTPAQAGDSGTSLRKLEVSPGVHVVEVSAPGLLAQLREVEVAPGSDTTLAFELAPAPRKPSVVLRDERVQVPFRFRAKEPALSGEHGPLIAELVDAMVRGGVKKLWVEAHTDNRGDPAALQTLSEARAAAIVDALRSAGVPSARLEAAGFGATQPRAPNLTAAGRKRNNRVELRIEK
jgi:OmpA-OmpF porin, OOP family